MKLLHSVPPFALLPSTEFMAEIINLFFHSPISGLALLAGWRNLGEHGYSLHEISSKESEVLVNFRMQFPERFIFPHF